MAVSVLVLVVQVIFDVRRNRLTKQA
jgi:hypothetical protein